MKSVGTHYDVIALSLLVTGNTDILSKEYLFRLEDREVRVCNLIIVQLYIFIRSNHWGCSVKKDVLKNFANFTGKHLCQSLF